MVSTVGRLVRSFPGPVVAIENTKLLDDGFRSGLAQCIESLEGEEIQDSVTKISGQQKDTVHPQFVTEFLTGILRGFGSLREGPRIYKRTRDDVVWGGGHEPWRRSPRWMLLRVALQTSLAGPGGVHARYKGFMIYFMATILDRAVQYDLSSDTLQVMLAKINRRIQKFDVTIHEECIWPDEAQEFVAETMKTAHQLIQTRWKKIQRIEKSFRLADFNSIKPQKHSKSFTTVRLLTRYKITQVTRL